MTNRPTTITATAADLGDSYSVYLKIQPGDVPALDLLANTLAAVALDNARNGTADPTDTLDHILRLAHDSLRLNHDAPLTIGPLDGEDD